MWLWLLSLSTFLFHSIFSISRIETITSFCCSWLFCVCLARTFEREYLLIITSRIVLKRCINCTACVNKANGLNRHVTSNWFPVGKHLGMPGQYSHSLVSFNFDLIGCCYCRKWFRMDVYWCMANSIAPIQAVKSGYVLSLFYSDVRTHAAYTCRTNLRIHIYFNVIACFNGEIAISYCWPNLSVLHFS